MIFFVGFLCIFNVIMWIVFLKKFKNLFTTDDTIQNAKEQINKILQDLNNQTARNISLIEDRCSKMKALNAEAEKKIKLLNNLESNSVAMQTFKQELNNAQKTASDGVKKNVSRAASKYSSNSKDSYVSLTKNGANYVEASSQSTLFDDVEKESKPRFEVIDDGSSNKIQEIPVVTPNVVYSDNPIKKSVNIKLKIVELYNQGLTIEDISAQLGISTGEVQFAVDLNRNF